MLILIVTIRIPTQNSHAKCAEGKPVLKPHPAESAIAPFSTDAPTVVVL